jgi:hypothetical protein
MAFDIAVGRFNFLKSSCRTTYLRRMLLFLQAPCRQASQTTASQPPMASHQAATLTRQAQVPSQAFHTCPQCPHQRPHTPASSLVRLSTRRRLSRASTRLQVDSLSSKALRASSLLPAQQVVPLRALQGPTSTCQDSRSTPVLEGQVVRVVRPPPPFPHPPR